MAVRTVKLMEGHFICILAVQAARWKSIPCVTLKHVRLNKIFPMKGKISAGNTASLPGHWRKGLAPFASSQSS